MAARIRKGDKVVVITGRDKGRSGEVIKVMPKENRALVRGVNMVMRHQRQSTTQEGGIIRKEAPIHLSNVALADPTDRKADQGRLQDARGRPQGPLRQELGRDHQWLRPRRPRTARPTSRGCRNIIARWWFRS